MPVGSRSVRPLSVGPVLGHTTPRSARLWGRGEAGKRKDGSLRRGFVAARLREASRSTWSATLFNKANPNFDFTGVIVAEGLQPATTYTYQMGWIPFEGEFDDLHKLTDLGWSAAAGGSFTTPDEDPAARRSVVFGSCRYLLRFLGGAFGDDRGDKTFRSILQQVEESIRTDLFFMIGDQIYADDLRGISPDTTVDEYFARYRAVLSQPGIRALMARVPTYMMLDDHEIEDNWPERATSADIRWKFPAAMHAYLTYQMSHSPLYSVSAASPGRIDGIPKRLWHSFSSGCCDFFFADLRTERYLVRDPLARRIMSPEQLDALESWLVASPGRVKVVISSVPLFPDSLTENPDKWSGFPAQRARLLSVIETHELRKVIFLSGDIHCSMASRITSLANPDVSVLSLIASPFFWPYPHPRAGEFALNGPLEEPGGARFTVSTPGPVHDTECFARLALAPDSAGVEFYSRKNVKLSAHRFAF